MSKDDPRRAAARSMVIKFEEEFLNEFGVVPTVIFSLDNQGNKYPTVSLAALEEVINFTMMNRHPKFYRTGGIRNRKRTRPLVIYRQVFFKIAMEVGYGQSRPARHLMFNHATVIHSIKTINTLLETGEMEVTTIYNHVINAYKNRFGNDGDVQQDSGSELNT